MSTPEIIRWDQAYNRNGDGKLPRAVLNVIRTYMDNHTLDGWVSQETLARDTGLDESNVRRQIKKNADAGWIVVTKRGRAGRASEYRLTYPQPGADARLDSGSDESPTVQIRTVTDGRSNRAQMPGYTPQPGADARLLPGADARPTSPRTSPQEKFSIAVEGSEATEGVADSRGPVGPSWSEPASAGSTAEPEARPSPDSDPWGGSTSEPATATEGATEAPKGLVGLQPPTATEAPFDDPWAEAPAWVAEARAREERAARNLELATAATTWPHGDPWA